MGKALEGVRHAFDASTLAQSGSMLTRMQDMAVAGLVACTVFALIVMVAVVLVVVPLATSSIV